MQYKLARCMLVALGQAGAQLLAVPMPLPRPCLPAASPTDMRRGAWRGALEHQLQLLPGRSRRRGVLGLRAEPRADVAPPARAAGSRPGRH